MGNRLCDIPECSDLHYGKGMCRKHYDRAHQRVRKFRGECGFDGCVNPRNGKTYCVAHERNLKAGKELAPLRPMRKVIDGMKECADCNQVLPEAQFNRKGDTVMPRCKSCQSIENRWRRYGITRDQVIDLLARPCDSCGASPGGRYTHIDHDHDTGEVRGVLCHNCNVALGHAKDDPTFLRALADYIERTRHGVT